MFKVATWNVNSLRVRLTQVLTWLETEQVDVLALQETKLIDTDFPVIALKEAGYHVIYSGQKTYNGVALLSRSVASDSVTDFPNYADPQRRLLAATIAGVRIINVYVPNGASLDSDKYQYKLTWLQQLASFLATEIQQHQHVIMLGDFNIAPGDEDVHNPEQWTNSVLTSPEERAALGALTQQGLSDVFRQFEQEPASFSWWDYRQAAFRRNLGLRIDLILSSLALAQSCRSCIIDKIPRTWERPSDHTPVVAAYDLHTPLDSSTNVR